MCFNIAICLLLVILNQVSEGCLQSGNLSVAKRAVEANMIIKALVNSHTSFLRVYYYTYIRLAALKIFYVLSYLHFHCLQMISKHEDDSGAGNYLAEFWVLDVYKGADKMASTLGVRGGLKGVFNLRDQ